MPHLAIYDLDGDYTTFDGPDLITGDVYIRTRQGDTTAEIGPVSVLDCIDVLKEIADAASGHASTDKQSPPAGDDTVSREYYEAQMDYLRSVSERKRQRVIDHVEELDRIIRRRNEEIATLRAQIKDQAVPTTPRECLDLLRQIVENDKRFTPDDGTVHAGEGYVHIWDDGDIASNAKTTSTYTPFTGPGSTYLLDPREPEPEPEPEWHTAQIIHATAWAGTESEMTCRWALDAGGGWLALDGSGVVVIYHNDLSDVSVVWQGDESRG